MAGASGFPRYPQPTTPDSRAVGAALMQQGMGPGQMAPPTPATGPGQMAPAPPSGMPTDMPPVDPYAQLRADGAQRMTAPGQLDHGEAEPGAHSANALSIAVGEAMTRLGGGYKTDPNPYRDTAGHVRQLQQLGLSAVEAELLVQSGGV